MIQNNKFYILSKCTIYYLHNISIMVLYKYNKKNINY